MKTVFNFIAFICLLSLTSTLSAQFGVRAGVNLANLTVDPSEDEFNPGIKLGLGIGVFYKVPISDNFIIQPELNFMQHGSKSKISVLGITAENTLSFNYLQVPVILKFGFGDTDGLNFYVQGGPYVGIGIGKVKSKSCLDGECETEEIEYGDGDEGPKNPDFGVQLGAGLNMDQNISFDARYILGLQNLTSPDEGTIKHTGINLSVGYAF